MDQQSDLRDAMVARQLEARGIRNTRVLAAMRTVPRDAFVPGNLRSHAYSDRPLPIGCGQTISQPYVVARMAELAEIAPTDIVLDVGTGSGYGAAILSRLAARVVSVERHGDLAATARLRLEEAGIDNVEVHVADGTRGWSEATPYDAIIAAAAASTVPEPLKEQLAPGGRLVIPVGDAALQHLQVVRRMADGGFDNCQHEAVAFVPLVGS